MKPASLPRKVLKTNVFSTPGKRSTSSEANILREEDIFNYNNADNSRPLFQR